MSDSRKIEMKDGRTLEFGAVQKLSKDYGVTPAGVVFCQIDFDNGETVRVEVDPASDTGKQACGHGLSQKLGDAASGADNTNDAFEAVLEVASRVSNGEWLKQRGTGEGGTAKGASELVEALCEVLSQDKTAVREMLTQLKQADKLALRKTPAIAAVIERMRESRGPSKAEQEKAAAGAALLAKMKGG